MIGLFQQGPQYDDGIVLYTNKESIKRTGGLSWFKQNDEHIACRSILYL
ncbi:MAG: hypothetical protein ABI675_17760 [Chitinophagaceae bacterium]